MDTATFDQDRWGGKHPLGDIPSGLKTFLAPGSPPPTLVLSDSPSLHPNNVTVITETRGPCEGRLRIEGSYGSAITFTQYLTFYKSVSWFKVDTELSGDTENVEAMRIESSLDLSSGPISSASGARQRSDSRPISWVVVTDDESTVDVAAMDAWTPSNDIRFVVDPGPRLTAVLPVADTIPSLWYHFLVTPPADHFHTPAAAMPTDQEVAFE